MQSAAVQANLGQISDDYSYVLSSACIKPNHREELQQMYEKRIADLEQHSNAVEAELNEMKEKVRE